MQMQLSAIIKWAFETSLKKHSKVEMDSKKKTNTENEIFAKRVQYNPKHELPKQKRKQIINPIFWKNQMKITIQYFFKINNIECWK